MPTLRRSGPIRRGQHEVVGELVEAALDPEVGREGEREDERVRGHVAAGVVADHQHRALLGDVAEVANLAAEPEAREQPEQRQVARGVVGVAVVEVGREARCRRDARAPGGRSPAAAPPVARRGRSAAREPPGRSPGATPACRAGRSPLGAAAVALRLLGERRRQPSAISADVGASGAYSPRSQARGSRRPGRAAASALDCSRISWLVRSGSSTWGTWPHSRSTTWRRLREGLGDVAREAGRHEPVAVAPDEQRRRRAAR